MKAIVVREFGAPEVMKLEEVPVPEVGAGQVLVRVKAAGVNPVDTYIRSGTHAEKPNLPYTPGKDAGGIVEKVGEGVYMVSPGDSVYVGGSITGTYAEFALCEEKQVHQMPPNVSPEKGAGVFVPYATSYRALFQKARLMQDGRIFETVLVHGASGAVGIAAVQWVLSAYQTVIGTAGSEEGRRLLKEQGASDVLDHSDENYLEKIKEITNGKGVSLVLEMLANKNLQNDLEILEKSGRIVIIGNRGSLEFNPRAAMSKDATIFGMSLFNASDAEMDEIHAAIAAKLSSEDINPFIGKSFPLAEAAAAHHWIIEEKAYGKIILITEN
jgi:NADPH2:quinone reductase